MKVETSGLSLAELKALYEHEAVRARMREKRNRARTEILENIAALFCAFPDLDALSFYAYTPRYNDGDPCEHVQSGYVSINGFDEMEQSDISEGAFNEITGLISEMEPELEFAFGTNWKLSFRRLSDDEIDFEKTRYDCGH
jgi:hypothetical protein